MKRSEINHAIEWALKLLNKENIALPDFGYWKRDDWKANAFLIDTISAVGLGWDVTDFGLDNFESIGGVLFTLRNGSQDNHSVGVPYAEKLIMLREGQVLPLHFHFNKTEDIINRAGGVLALQLHNMKLDEGIDIHGNVIVYMDGIKHQVKAGEWLYVEKGCSITLTPYMYHTFKALEGKGDLIVGEVSSVNDDETDNRFNPILPRFGTIEPDEPILYPLCTEYEMIQA